MFLLSEMELRSQLKNMDRDSIFRMLLKHLERCETRLRYFEVTKSEVYKCRFTHAEPQWLKKLTAAFSEESDSNDIIKTIALVSEDKLTKTLGSLELSPREVDKVTSYYGAMKIASNPKVTVMELENIAIDCALLSRCRLCVSSHITGDKLEGMKFRGCLENNKISEPVFGECSLFISRRAPDEQHTP